MSRRRGTAIAGALLALLAIAGCGLGPGDDVGDAELTVTRDFGATPLLQRQVGDVAESDTVMRVLERNAELTTRYGGGFVQAIDGLEADRRDGRSYDWFFFVDGVESPIGAADFTLHGGEQVWWDYRDWTAVSRIPAVVGSWPAPFAGGYEGETHPVAVECQGGGGACAEVRERLEQAGIAVRLHFSLGSGRKRDRPSGKLPADALRVLVGPWARLRSDAAAKQIEVGPEESGVFAEFERSGNGYALVGLDESGDPVLNFGPGAGLVAATRRYEAPPVWVVTGGTPAAVVAAAELLDGADLRDHYAVATEGGKQTALPLAGRR
ncbi:MAG TPA: DUF4430 domain-containing protein [Solirubrobacterales bacterium]|jgi:hypothetical protein|nr:DUF4430 domain-containing protein [Solirubrobacterales bacterium]